MDSGKKADHGSGYLGLSAAFDTVDHDILLKILNKYIGICDKVLECFSSYLWPRFFKV